MVNPSEELQQAEARWARKMKATRNYADALEWFCQALTHVRAMSPRFGKPFRDEKEVLEAIADDIRVAAALNLLDEHSR